MIVGADVFVEGEKHDPLSVRRYMRKPVIVSVAGYFLLPAPVRVHSPDLHASRASRAEIDVFPVGRILRAVVQPFGSRQANLLASGRRNLVYIEFTIPSRGVYQELSVRRPPMHV